MDRLTPFRRFVLVIVLLSLSLFTQAQITPTGGIVYVRPTGTGSQNGSDWNNATSNLQFAIYAANVQKVFVAEGTYNTGTGIIMQNGVEIYGGFRPESGITNLSHNRIMPNATDPLGALQGTVLSGQNNSPVITNFFTSGSPLNTSAILDGFTIANGLGNYAGGVYNEHASPKLRNLVIRNCKTLTQPGSFAMGGGITNISSNPEICNTVICNNIVEDYYNNSTMGAGIYNYASSPALINVTITGNRLIAVATSNMRGAGICNDNNSAPTVRNSIIWNNQKSTNPTTQGADIENDNNSSITVTNTITQGYNTNFLPADNNKVNVNPQFTNLGGGDFTLQPTSPAINAGNGSYYPNTLPTKDLANNPRFSGAAIDMGAYEFNIIPDANGIVYVRPAIQGTGKGNSWSNASNNLQDAIDAHGAQKVFVAIGNHVPVSGNSYRMKEAVEIYGGFDPGNGITDLSHKRILPNQGTAEGSVLDGQNLRKVIHNNYTSGSTLGNTAVLDGFTIKNGRHSVGAGITNEYASAIFRNLVIKNNIGESRGGGIYNSFSHARFTNCIIRNNALENALAGGPNAAAQGGGVHNWGSDVTYTNVLISDNTAYSSSANTFGGGVYNGGAGTTSHPVFVNVTIANNKANSSQPGYGMGIANNGPVAAEVYNCIIWANTGTGAIHTPIDIRNDNGAGITIINSITQQYNTGNPSNNNLVGANPQFVDMATGNYNLMANSPAINTGNLAYFNGINANSIDLVGRPRVHKYNDGGDIDMGALEFPPVLVPGSNGIIYVKTIATGKGNGDSWLNATSDLHSAIKADGVQKVFVAKGTYATGTTSFEMKNGVEIYGGFDPDNSITDLAHNRILPNPANTQGSVLDAGAARPVIWNVHTSGATLNNTAILDGFTITNGYFDGGAGIRNIYASPALRNLVIRNNVSTTSGAGVYNENGSPLLTNVIISSNSISNTGIGVTIYGAGMYNISSSAPVLTNLTITGNTLFATLGIEKGAGIYNHNSSPLIYNSIIWNNQKRSNPFIAGADIEKEGTGTITLKNSSTQTYTTVPADNNITSNPMFVDANNGNYTLLGASPLINKGNNTYFAGYSTSKDLAGNPRLSGALIDMGAYEFPIAMQADANGIIYVKTQADGDRSGRDWANATDDLHNAIHLNGVQKVFVATGNYPVGETSFIMKNGVEIYGGFDPENSITDLTHNRVMPNPASSQGSVLNGQGARPVIWNVFASGTEMNISAVLDGFTITGGAFADGAGIRNIYASPTLRNLVIRGNTASSWGGGMLNNNSSPRVYNTIICNNTATHATLPVYGAGVCNNNNAAPEFINTTITGNTLSGSPMLGAGIYNASEATPKFYNSIIWNNRKDNDASIAGADIQNGTGVTPILKNSITQGYTTGNPADNNKVNANPLFTNASAGNFTLQNNSSPAVNAGDNSLFSGLNGDTKDLAGNARVHNSTNGGIIDMGAYESTFNSPLAPGAANIIYVKQTATGTGSGNSWANATADLHNAIHTTGVQKVFVAIGNYNVGATSFIMKNGVEIYGGFDPANSITDLAHNRILPTESVSGSVLNGQNARPVIWNLDNALTNTAILDGFTITEGNRTDGNGGGIYNGGAVAPILRNLVVKNNTALSYGGGIYNNNGANPVISNVLVTGNTAQSGAGIGNVGAGVVHLTNVHIVNNTATDAGGGMYNIGSTPQMTNAVIEDNEALYGGGVYNNNSPSVFTNVVIKNNRATMAGAGAGGGGIFNVNSNVILTNILIANNATNFQGGGFRNLSGNSLLTNVTIANNTAVNDATTTAMDIVAGTVYINNSIIYGTIAGSGTYTAQHSLIEADAGGTSGNLDGTAITAAQVFTDAPNHNYTLRNNAPVLDAGSNALYTALNSSTQDLAGNPRLSSAVIDMGAYEFPIVLTPDANKIIYVKPVATGDKDGSSWANATANLHDAIHADDVEKVFVAIGNYPVGDNSFVMKNDVAIYGGFDPANNIIDLTHNRILPNHGVAEGSVLDGGNAKPVIWNAFSSSAPLNSTAVLDGFTITGGKAASGYTEGNYNGGGIYNYYASPTLRNLTIRGNYSANAGGGIANEQSSAPIMTNILITGNSSGNVAGGLYNYHAGSLTLTNVTIVENTSSSTGRGIYNSSTQLTLTNVTIAGHAAPAIYDGSGALTLKNSIVWGQIANGSYTAQNSLIQGSNSTDNGNINASTVNTNKLFTDFANGDYTLRPGSPAINAGSNALFNGLNGTTQDLAGNLRLANTAIDLGAYESPNPGLAPDANNIIYVNTTYSGNGSGSDWANATDNLHNAIHTTGVQKVFVATGNYPVGENSYIMKNGVEIYGGFDPLNGITDLTHNRTLPNRGASEGSVLDGQNARPVIWNHFTSTATMDNTAVLDGFTVKNGYSDYGGGIHNVYASPLLRNLLVKTNRALWGGGISAQSSSSPTITDVLIYDNLSYGAGGGGGGAIYSDDGAPVLTNVAIIANRANLDVGGYYCRGGMPVFNNVTIAGNQQEGFLAISGGNISLHNSIVYNNGFINHGTYTAQHSLIQGSPATANGNINATGINGTDIFTNPGIGDYTLKNGSPAVGKGNNALFAGLDNDTRDLAGNPRVSSLAMGGVIDLGAYESTFMGAPGPDANGVVYVREGYAGNGENWMTATGNLQGAIDATNVNAVYVAVGNYNVSPTASFVMKNNVAIYGGFNPDNGIGELTDYRILPNEGSSEGSVLNGLNTRTVIRNVFTVSTAMDNTAVLDGFTIKNADGNSGSTNYDGGAFYNEYASPTLRNLLIKQNYALRGGGMYNRVSNPAIYNVKITDNIAFDGAAIWNIDNSSPTLTNVEITGNRTTNTNTEAVVHTSGTLTLKNVTIAGNNSPGALYKSAPCFIDNSIIYGGTTGGTPYTAQHSLIQGNTNFTNGNLNPANVALTDIFTDPANGDYTLAVQSPAINRGSNALFPGFATAKDLAGYNRVYNLANGGVIDMGALESSYETPVTHDGTGIVYVRQGFSGTGSSWLDATGDLQAAIDGLNVTKVYVATGTYNTPVFSEGFVMKNAVEIYGGFDPANGIQTLNDERILPNHGTQEGSILNGNNSRVINNEFTSATALLPSALLDGFTVKNGGIGEGANGGGINNVYASPTLRNLLIKDNAVYSGNGGGISNTYNSSPAITNVIITNNESETGSAIYNSNGSAPVLTNVLIADNSSSDDDYQVYDLSGGEYNNVSLIGDLYAAAPTTWNNVIVFGNFDMPLGISYTAQYSLIQGNTNFTNGNLDASLYALTDIFVDPDNANYKLKPGSPAINAGSNALFAGLDADTKDLAGNPRLLNGAIDMGTFEFDPNAPLPIKLLSFTVHKQGTTALLQWMTATEQNSKGFEVQRSTDGSQWQPLTFVASKAVNGNSTQELHYSYTDNTPVQGKNYYRLKQLEDGGTFEYSPVRMIAFDGSRVINMYPNPAHEQVAITGLAGGETITIYDAAGKMLMRREGNSTTELISVSGFSQGVYHLQVDSAGGALIFTGKLVKAD